MVEDVLFFGSDDNVVDKKVVFVEGIKFLVRLCWNLVLKGQDNGGDVLFNIVSLFDFYQFFDDDVSNNNGLSYFIQGLVLLFNDFLSCVQYLIFNELMYK